MSIGLEQVREQMARYLQSCGIDAVTAWPAAERTDRERELVVVSLRGCRAGPAGFQDYLGERFDEKTGLWQELYGRKATLTFGLDIYAPKQADGGLLQEAFDRIAQAMTRGCPSGLTVQELSCGETEYDGQSRRMKRSVQAVCQAYLYAAAQPDGLFTDFELRGDIKR